MKRNIVKIDEAKCNGCGECLSSCHEGALVLVDGKARLAGDLYCDGLGACLAECPQGAISVEEREAAVFDEVAVEKRKLAGRSRLRVLGAPDSAGPETSGCPGSTLRTLSPGLARPAPLPVAAAAGSQLGQWPVQLRLVPSSAPFLAGADVVVCADCVPFAVPDFHARYLSGRAVVVGCPKLDDAADMEARLAALVSRARPRRITVVRMEVPCCAGIAHAAIRAAEADGADFPIEDHVVGVGGGITERKIR